MLRMAISSDRSLLYEIDFDSNTLKYFYEIQNTKEIKEVREVRKIEI
jgi:hypothetical protein